MARSGSAVRAALCHTCPGRQGRDRQTAFRPDRTCRGQPVDPCRCSWRAVSAADRPGCRRDRQRHSADERNVSERTTDGQHLVFTSITVQATTSVTVVDPIDLSTSSFGTPQYNLSIVSPVCNIDGNVNLAATGNLILTCNTVNLFNGQYHVRKRDHARSEPGQQHGDPDECSEQRGEHPAGNGPFEYNRSRDHSGHP